MSYERTSVNRPCTTRTTEYRHRTSSSCNSYEGGWFPSVPSRSGVAPTPDRKLDTIRKSAIAPLGVLRVTYQAHHNALVNRTKTRHHMRLGKTWRTLLPQVGAEDLNQTNLEGGDLSVHEDTGQIKLDLETDVYICAIDSRAPPQRKPSVGVWFRPDPWAFVRFLYLVDWSKPDAFSQNRPSQVGK